MEMDPSSGSINRLIIRSVVVFPDPEPPIRMSSSPPCTSRLTSSTATVSPNLFVIPRTVMVSIRSNGRF
ncbi:hypothetical protein J2T58_002186 [Methanocalculus alkaliphilus]|nr:hypothetical protein [Methanocalculus alkaliphilus]